MRQRGSQLCDQFCIFRVGSESFALAASSVREVAEHPPVVRVPDSPSALVGLCHLRNEFLPVLSLRDLLMEGDERPQEERFVLVMTGADGPWALPISRALDLEALETAVASDADWGDPIARAVVGTATFRDDVVRVLDADALYRLAEEVLESDWRSGSQSPHSLHGDTAGSQRMMVDRDQILNAFTGGQR